jgi:hypothetical protein
MFTAFLFVWRNSPIRACTALLLRFLDHTQLDTHTHTHTVGLFRTGDQLVEEAATCT